MSDVETWSPVDESNTAAPPDGWPEFMMPSGVNNCGRMMMGAVRRMYDKNVSGATVLPYLKLVGGQTVTGPVTFSAGVTASAITSTGTINAASTISTSGGISASGNVSGGSVSASGNINAAGTYTGGAVSVNGRVTAGNGEVYGSGWALSGGGGNLNIGTGSVGNLGTLTFFANTVSAVGLLSFSGGNVSGIPFGNDGGWFRAYSGGKFDNVQSLGFITAAGAITAGGSIWAHNAAGNFGLTSDGDYWLRFRSDMGFHFQNSTANCWWQIGPTPSWIMTTNGFCYAATNSVGGNGDYVNISDRRIKEEITPATQGLPEVLQLQPVMFRRTAEAAPLAGAPAWELGFVAQDVAPVLPEAVSVVPGPAEVTDPLLGVSVGSITAAIVNALKTIDARLTAGGL